MAAKESKTKTEAPVPPAAAPKPVELSRDEAVARINARAGRPVLTRYQLRKGGQGLPRQRVRNDGTRFYDQAECDAWAARFRGAA